MLGATALQENDAKAAEGYFGRMLAEQPKSAMAGEMRFLLGNSKFGQSKYDEAQKEYEKYQSDYPSGPHREESFYRVVLAVLFSGNYDDAFKRVKRLHAALSERRVHHGCEVSPGVVPVRRAEKRRNHLGVPRLVEAISAGSAARRGTLANWVMRRQPPATRTRRWTLIHNLTRRRRTMRCWVIRSWRRRRSCKSAVIGPQSVRCSRRSCATGPSTQWWRRRWSGSCALTPKRARPTRPSSFLAANIKKFMHDCHRDGVEGLLDQLATLCRAPEASQHREHDARRIASAVPLARRRPGCGTRHASRRFGKRPKPHRAGAHPLRERLSLHVCAGRMTKPRTTCSKLGRNFTPPT